MAKVQSNGIDIEYEEFGDPQAPAILLIMGLGMQLVAWPRPFCLPEPVTTMVLPA